MPRYFKIALGILTVAVLIGLISLRGLHQRMQGLAESQSTEEKARREVLAPEIKTPTDVPQGAKIYWGCRRRPGRQHHRGTCAVGRSRRARKTSLTRPHCRYPITGTANDPCRRRTARVLYPARRNYGRRLFRRAFFGNSFRNRKRATRRGFNIANTGEQCRDRAPPENSHPRARS